MLPLFLLQVVVVAICAQVLGRLLSRFGQPRVIGEMVAGIALGPSLLGWIAPQLHHTLFPDSSLPLLNLFGQIGLIFYMFVVGMTLNIHHLREQKSLALASSIAGIAAPFVCGFIFAATSYKKLSLPGIPMVSFSLFVAVCMSITAFPVLARILQETGLMNTRLGSVAIASAAFGDVIAWLILAAILAFSAAPSGGRPLWRTVALLGVYVLVMLLFRGVWATLNVNTAAPALIVAMASAAATEWIGVHALFGAFFAGVMIPKTPAFVAETSRLVDPLTTAMFLPVFFAFTGLRTHLDLVLSRELLGYTVLVLIVAIAGKWLGAMFAARSMGMPRREAHALGILMNARGLVELVILSIGYDLGLLSPAVFSMLVLMALVTTFMTAPLVRRVYPFNTGFPAPVATAAGRSSTTGNRESSPEHRD